MWLQKLIGPEMSLASTSFQATHCVIRIRYSVVTGKLATNLDHAPVKHTYESGHVFVLRIRVATDSPPKNTKITQTPRWKVKTGIQTEINFMLQVSEFSSCLPVWAVWSSGGWLPWQQWPRCWAAGTARVQTPTVLPTPSHLLYHPPLWWPSQQERMMWEGRAPAESNISLKKIFLTISGMDLWHKKP